MTSEFLKALAAVLDHDHAPQAKLAALLEACHLKPSDLWDRLAHTRLDVDADVDRLADFLDDQFWSARHLPPPLGARGELTAPVGLVFMLDTLNMESHTQTNLDVGFAGTLQPTEGLRWIDRAFLPFDSDHLIEGLRQAKRVYARPEYRPGGVSDFADLYFFLGYAGIVISEALFSSPVPFSRYEVAWGHHDGDFFVLGRGAEAGYVRQAELAG